METKLKTEKGIAICQKMDIFKGLLWYTYKGEWMHWYELTAAAAQEIIEKNRNGEIVAALEEYTQENEKPEAKEVVFENVVGQDSLNRFDRPKRRNKGRNKNWQHRNRKSKRND